MHTRRLLFTSLFALLLIFSVLTEKTNAQPVDFGITGGLTLSAHLKAFAFHEDDISLWLDPKLTTGYTTGFIARKDLSKSLRIQSEPSIILLGAHYDQPFELRGFEFETESRTKLLYLQVPLLLQLSTVPKKPTVFGRPFNVTTFHLTGGIFGGYLLNATFSGTNTGAPIGVDFEGDFSNDVANQYKEIDGGIMLGTGFEHGSNDKVGFELRAQFSIIDSGDAANNEFFQPQNLGVSFSVYYLL